MSAATKESLSQADIILNRTNVALARSQRLIQSWLPPKPQAEHQDSPHQPAADEDDDDFRGDSEIGGIGSAAQRADDSGLPEGVFKRRNPGANDKLLDSLLGKKAANAHRKAQAQAKSAAGAGAGLGAAQQGATSKSWTKEPVKKRSAQDSDSDEEEGGRAAAFKSKRSKPSVPPLRKTPEDTVESSGANADVAEEDGESGQADVGLKVPQETTSTVKSGRKRPASYLDELLGQKANKKSKKKKKAAAEANAG